MDDCTAGSWLMASWPLLMSSLEPPPVPGTYMSDTRESITHAPTAALASFNSLLLPGSVLLLICLLSTFRLPLPRLSSHHPWMWPWATIAWPQTCLPWTSESASSPSPWGFRSHHANTQCVCPRLGAFNPSSKFQANLVSGTRRGSVCSNLTCPSQDPPWNLPPLKSFLCYPQSSKENNGISSHHQVLLSPGQVVAHGSNDKCFRSGWAGSKCRGLGVKELSRSGSEPLFCLLLVVSSWASWTLCVIISFSVKRRVFVRIKSSDVCKMCSTGPGMQ